MECIVFPEPTPPPIRNLVPTAPPEEAAPEPRIQAETIFEPEILWPDEASLTPVSIPYERVELPDLLTLTPLA